ncbi:MAG: RNA polymerase sigma factor [Vicinamibacterales bacterium]
MTANQTEFVALLDQHAGILRKVAATYAWHISDRRDLMQEMTLQLWKAWPRYDAARPFATWMYRIALNVGISFVRRAGHPARQAVSLHDAGIDPIDPAAPDDGPDERIEQLHGVIQGLGPLDRALLLLYLEERSYREIADVLGISETNVGTKINRLKQRVREAMASDAVSGPRLG